MESQPQNPEFKINPENFHPCIKDYGTYNGVFGARNIMLKIFD